MNDWSCCLDGCLRFFNLLQIVLCYRQDWLAVTVAVAMVMGLSVWLAVMVAVALIMGLSVWLAVTVAVTMVMGLSVWLVVMVAVTMVMGLSVWLAVAVAMIMGLSVFDLYYYFIRFICIQYIDENDLCSPPTQMKPQWRSWPEERRHYALITQPASREPDLSSELDLCSSGKTGLEKPASRTPSQVKGQ